MQKVTYQDFQTALTKLILSASGWRGVFAESGNEQDPTEKIDTVHETVVRLMAAVYADFALAENRRLIAVGTDSRPTGKAIAKEVIKVLLAKGLDVEFLGITAAPEIMAYSHKVDGFVYISASHNPIGHNGIKFGRNDGGVIPGTDASKLAASFKELCADENIIEKAEKLASSAAEDKVQKVYDNQASSKQKAVNAYYSFTKRVIADTEDESSQTELFSRIKKSVEKTPFAVVCDMNGSARSLSIDSKIFAENGIGFFAINNAPGAIVHEIIPEPENLIYCAGEMEAIHNGKGKSVSGTHPEALLGYMPDCDGDRGNIVFWNEKTGKAEVLKAQEVFAVSVMSELAWLKYSAGDDLKAAVSVNDPTSMRIEEIAGAFGAKVFRAEVGEANVVNRARELRQEGYTVRILGEGSNGGNITHPAAVRDPLNTIFALIKLLVLKDEYNADGSISRKGLFHTWCSLSGQEASYKEDFSLADVMETLPVYTTTGVSEKRALLHIKSTDHAALKAAYQKIFEKEWAAKKADLDNRYGIVSYEAIANNATKETRNVTDFSVSGRGGLKILLKDKNNASVAFIWMRGSGTEPVFRIMCDVKGNCSETEKELLEWHSKMIEAADLQAANA